MWTFDNSYARDLPEFYVKWQGEAVPQPRMVKFNTKLADALGLDVSATDENTLAEILSGAKAATGSEPLAQAYAGHQFGHFNPQLGDGRALLLGEIVSPRGERFDIQLKGSGRTPFSRNGDGKAALGPVLREYIISEAMAALGIPTTRSLAAVATGEDVYRETTLRGAVLARVAASHIRVGTFQFFASRGETEKVKQLADYTIRRHYPDIADAANPYAALLDAVVKAQSSLIAKWMQVGFVHGVMNTDNMTVSGETIDYGPCAFIDIYSARAVFSSIDHGGRYAFGNQPGIALWNLSRFAECLVPLIDADPDKAVTIATEILEGFEDAFLGRWLDGMRKKIGLMQRRDDDLLLVRQLHDAMEGQQVDFTSLFRALARQLAGDQDAARDLFLDRSKFDDWSGAWLNRLKEESPDHTQRIAMMNAVNPLIIPRNHKVEEALAAANEDDLRPLDLLLDAITHPFEDRGEAWRKYASPAPDSFGAYRTFCGT
jgi:serine/tyrosine/threonine adenylyltransferase